MPGEVPDPRRPRVFGIGLNKTATFSLSATNDQYAFDLGVTIWIESGVASGLSPNEVVRSEIELVQPESAQVSEATAVPA